MKNKEARKKLNQIYGARCFLTNIQGEQYQSLHHLEKLAHGGKTNVSNGANTNRVIHDWLHNEIEREDKELFYLINECIDLYKQCLYRNLTKLTEQYENECMPIFRKKYSAYKKRR